MNGDDDGSEKRQHASAQVDGEGPGRVAGVVDGVHEGRGIVAQISQAALRLHHVLDGPGKAEKPCVGRVESTEPFVYRKKTLEDVAR